MSDTVKRFSLTALAASMLLLSATAMASGFQLWEQDSSGIGNYHAGGAAEADSPGTEYYNPAGMVRLHHKMISAGVAFIPLDIKFSGTVTFGVPAATGDVTSNTFNMVPNIHYVQPLNDKWHFGFGVTVPFGLSTSFPASNTASAKAATTTKLQAINFNPNLAYAVTPKFSVGFGGDVVSLSARYDSIIGVAFTNKMHDYAAFGWNAGVLYQFTPGTRFGLSYRSKVVAHARGTSHFDGTTSNDLTAKLVLPDTTMVSLFSQVTPKWDVMASADYTQWDLFGNLELFNTAMTLGSPDILIHENYHNTWNYALGVQWHQSSVVTLKAGVGYDQTPTRTGYRDIRLPDASRIALGLGVHLQPNQNLGIDVGGMHLFVSRSGIDNTDSGIPVTETGDAKMNADVIGAQFTWSFV